MREADEVLYSRFLEKGDEQALGELMNRHKESLTLFLYSYLHDMDDAEDMMLETFAVVGAGSSRYVSRGEGSFKTWLFAVGRNQAHLLLRKKKGFFVPFEEQIAFSGDPPDLELLKEETNRQLYLALDRLKPEYRRVLYLLYMEQLSHEEISLIMKKNKKQIYNLAARGRAQLKEYLEKAGFDYSQY